MPIPDPTPPTKENTDPTLTFNWKDWLPYVENADLTDDQKRKMIEALWSIVIAFVDLGWDVAATGEKTCGQHLDLRAALDAAVLNSKASSEPDETGTLPGDVGTDEAAQTPNTKEPV